MPLAGLVRAQVIAVAFLSQDMMWALGKCEKVEYEKNKRILQTIHVYCLGPGGRGMLLDGRQT